MSTKKPKKGPPATGWADLHCFETGPRRERERDFYPSNKIANARRRAYRAAAGEHCVTCPASRHVAAMANALSQGNRVYPMFVEEPEHCAGSLYSVCESVWKLRTLVKELRAKLCTPEPRQPERHP